MPFVVGVDVGGTNTDAVLLRDECVVSSFKHATAPEPIHGIVSAIKGALKNCTIHDATVRANVTRVCIGTTHFVNAVVERSRDKLVPVAVVRLCGPASLAVPPFADFPQDMKDVLMSKVYMISGGLEYNGTSISQPKLDEIRGLGRELLSAQPPIKHVVVSGVFSPLDDPMKNQEKLVADTLLSIDGDFSITQASWIGRLGLIERENAAILNESLKALAAKTITDFQRALKDLQFDCPLYLTQNDGTLIDVEEAVKNPILTFSSGPTNSMRGAMFLSGIKDGLVVDIGGTTTDIGVLCNGFPREASSQVKIGGVRTNFQMPDVVSIGLGGGSKVTINQNTNVVQVGPESVGYRLTEEAQCFGGNVLTATDIAVVTGIAKLQGTKLLNSINATCSVAYKVMREIRSTIETLIDTVKTDKKDVPVLLVGGGAILVDTSVPLKGASCVIFPPNYQVANAVGAALGTVAGRSERVENLREVMESLKIQFNNLPEEELRAKATEAVIQKGIGIATEIARKKGCIVGTEVLHEKSAIPVTYVPDALKVSVKVIGQLSQTSAAIKPSAEVATDQQHKPTNEDNSKDNPHWPFSSAEDRQKDESAGLPVPVINPTTGEWVLTTSDVECISIGAGILGCGGGGSPYIGRVIALRLLEQGKEIKIMNPWRVKKDEFGLAVPVAFMGAPVVVIEKLCSGTESPLCLSAIQKILATGVCEESCDYGRKETEGVTLTTRDLSSGNKIWLPADLSKLPSPDFNSSQIPLERRISGVIGAEIGGMNSIEPMVTAARVGLPLLDADGMGRAFPELQMFLPFINGSKAYPSCVADEKGNVIAVTHVTTAKDLEEFFRIECVNMGMICAICLPPLSLEDVLTKCVLLSYSQAWQLGRAILRTRALGGISIVDAIAKQQKGVVLVTGKIIDVCRNSAGGFTNSTVVVQGLSNYSGKSVVILVKNENLVAHELNSDGNKGKVLAVTPDLITIIDSDSGYPITTEDVSYGLRVAVLSLPACPGMTTPRALEVVGPKAFGYDDISYQ